MELALQNETLEERQEPTPVIDVCPIHGCVYDDRGLCELCEEEKALPIWATPQEQIREIMEKIPGGTWRS
jgi:hypothetical protein